MQNVSWENQRASGRRPVFGVSIFGEPKRASVIFPNIEIDRHGEFAESDKFSVVIPMWSKEPTDIVSGNQHPIGVRDPNAVALYCLSPALGEKEAPQLGVSLGTHIYFDVTPHLGVLVHHIPRGPIDKSHHTAGRG